MSNNRSSSSVRLDGISVTFGNVVAVDNANISIKSGEFFTLLGPSGCGKTTLLRSIAGFYRQSSGTITLGDQVVDDVPAYDRDTGMVFQNYAVFPHLSVWDNVAYGLKSRGITGAEAVGRIKDVLEMVDLAGYEKRMPKQLSGGQQQRVVIARAVVIRPRVLLMDEPLANLDAKLRVRLRNDLKKLQRNLGITTIYVTHDQEEALSLSDRMAVMSGGKVLQVGTPEEVYTTPATLSVAEFIGEGNFLRGTAEPAGDGLAITMASGVKLISGHPGKAGPGPAWIGFRPQDAVLRPAGSDVNGFTGTVVAKTYLGSYVRLELDCGLERPVSIQLNAREVERGIVEGSSLTFHLDPSEVMAFPGAEQDVEL